MKRFRSKHVAALSICLFDICLGHSAAADPSGTDKATATELFKEGRGLLDQGRVAPACRKLEESQRLDPGGGTLLNVALCHEREGRTATAWVEFTEALGIAKRDERPQRVEFARTHIALIEPTLSRLVIEVPSAADLPDLEVKRDGSTVGRAAWGSAIPVDPGDHVVDVSAPGRVAWTQSVVVGPKGDVKTLAVPVLDAATTGEKRQVEPSSPGGAGAALQTTPEVDGSPPESAGKAVSERPPAVNAVAWAAVGVGLVATGLGTYFALNAMSLKNDADRNCPNDACSAQGATQNSDAIQSANFATAGFAAGIVGLGLGTVLFATRGAAHHTASAARSPFAMRITAGNVSLGPGKGEVTIAGHW